MTTGEEHVFKKGDFYVIEPGVVYAQQSAPDTEILFIKVPPGNEKVPVDITPEIGVHCVRRRNRGGIEN